MPILTPKARLNQLYPAGKSKELRYETKQIPVLLDRKPVSGEVLFRPAVHGCSYCCTLYLPDGQQVDSRVCSRKRDAEHDAAQRALDMQLSKEALVTEDMSPEGKWEQLLTRTGDTFSDKHVLSYLPLVEHFRTAVKRKDSRYGQVPATAILALESKIWSICKAIDRATEVNPSYALSILCKAASLCPYLKVDFDTLCISRVKPFDKEVEQELLAGHPVDFGSDGKLEQSVCMEFTVVCIPSSPDKLPAVDTVTVQSEQYYLDVLAHNLGLKEAGQLLMSRAIGKCPSDMRLYWPKPETLPNVHVLESDFSNLGNTINEHSVDAILKTRVQLDEVNMSPTKASVNERASMLVGFAVHGDATLASVGCTWRSEGKVICNDVPLNCFYRLLLAKSSEGNYKLSRGSILAAKLPTSFSSRTQWRGMMPRNILTEFLQQRRLADPLFVLYPSSSKPQDGSLISGQLEQDFFENRKATGETQFEILAQEGYLGCPGPESKRAGTASQGPRTEGPFKCIVKLVGQKGVKYEYESDATFKNHNDAVQSAALKALHKQASWLEPSGSTCSSFNTDGCEQVELEFPHCVKFAVSEHENSGQKTIRALDNPQSELLAPAGSLVTISYTAWLLGGSECRHRTPMKLLEKIDDFEFELGSGAVIPIIDAVVAKTCVGQENSVYATVPAACLLFATSHDFLYEECQSVLETGFLKYSITLLKYVEPAEERMEAALFKPPLSKQRVEFAVSLIRKLQAQSLVDLGCGSGSLLEGILEQSTDLVDVAGVDISVKGLARAAKLLSLKLGARSDILEDQTLKRVSLYEGSIVEFDSRLYNYDLATCIEVVEHMDPEPLSKIGKSILGGLSPRVFMVSTPNIEFNPILQRMPWDPQTSSLLGTDSAENTAEKKMRLSDSSSAVHQNVEKLNPQSASVKLRNEDHRFEWTRAEFQDWAIKLSLEYGYEVEFDGVGVSPEFDAVDVPGGEGPGFASQIAVFKKKITSLPLEPSPDQVMKVGDISADLEGRTTGPQEEHIYTPFWEWGLIK